MGSFIGLKLKMTPPKQVTMILVLFLAIIFPKLVVSQQDPYFFNYQPQHQQYQQPPQYQPFTNAPPPPPPGTYYTPTYESHTPGGGGSSQGPEHLGNFFNNGFSSAPPSAPPSSPLVPYPTQVSTLDGARHHLSHQPYQPVGNSLLQQSPTVPTTTTTNTAFRPSPLINHHTHIVNGLPRQQFFGNNYAFLRDIHGLQGFPPTSSPYFGHNTLQTAPPKAAAPSPTPTALASAAPSKASPSASPSKASESKTNPGVKTLALDLPSRPSPPLTTQSTFLSRFPFHGPSTFSPVTSQRQTYKPVAAATTPAPRNLPTARPTASSFGVSPSFQFSQNFPETDNINSNELARQPLFQEEDEEDDFTITYNGQPLFNNQGRQVPQQQQQRPQQQPQQRPEQQQQRPQQQQQQQNSQQFNTSPINSASTFKFPQENSFNSGSNSNNNALNSQTKDEPAPIRVHNTTPIRIVFNYEQAAQALEETPGVRVVIAHTEKNNLTEDEFSTTTSRPYVTSPSPTRETQTRSGTSPAVYQPTTPRPTQNYGTYRPAAYQPGNYQPTTPRPTQNYGTYRPAAYQPGNYQPTTYRPSPAPSTYSPPVSSTQRPQQYASPTPRFQYEPINVPYNNYNTQTGNGEGTTAALENLALELEGRFGSSTGRPQIQQQQPYYDTVATLATEPTPTEDPLKTYKRGGKKYVVIPSAGEKVYKSQEPRVVVNDLANILVQTVQPGGHYSATPPSTFPRQTFQQPQQYQPVEEVGQTVDDDLSEEIAHLNEQLQQDIQTTPRPHQTTPRPRQTTPRSRQTTTTPRPQEVYSSPKPRLQEVYSSPQPRLRPSSTPRLLRITTYRPPFTFPSTFRSTTTTTTTTAPPPPPPPPPPSPTVEEEDEEDILPEVNNQLTSDPTSLTGRRQPQRYYYNNKQSNGVSGAHQRYEYNGADGPSPATPSEDQPDQPQPQAPKKTIRRRLRPRGRLVHGGPPRAVQVNGGPPGPLGPIGGPQGLPPHLQFGPGPGFPGSPLGPLGPLGPGAQVGGPGQVFRVGPRGRLLRRKSRPRAQLQGQQPSLAPSQAPSAAPSFPPSLAPSPSSPPVFPAFSPIPQDIGGPGPSQFPPTYSPSPFIPQELVTTFRPGPPPNSLIQQSLIDEEEERKTDRPNNFRSRFRYTPSKPTSSSVEDDDEGASNQSESEEEAPVPQRRRPFSTTTTTEKPAEREVASDRANILQRQIRFNRNRKNQRNNKES